MIEDFTRRSVLATGATAVLASAVAVPGDARAAETAAPRSRERLAEWRFHPGHAADQEQDFGFGRNQRTFAKAGNSTADAAMAKFDDAAWQAVRVPHDWAVALPFARPETPAGKDMEDAAAAHGFKAIGRAFPGNSIGWYRRTIAVTAADRGRRLWLEFDGVFRDCLVFVNGHIVGRNESGYAPFAVAIDDFLDYDGGPNILALRVDATLGEGWFYEGAGLYRHVDLVRADPLHMPQWHSVVRSEVGAAGARVTAATEVFNSGAAEASGTLRRTLIAPDGRTVALPDATFRVAPGERITLDADARVIAPVLWSVETPKLYRMACEIVVSDRVIDADETRFGIRTLRFDAERGFLLNGKPVKLLGTCNHQDHAGVGSGIPDALHAFRIAQLQSMGSNAWRSAHNPPAAALLDLCDEMGMLMIVEARLNSSEEEAMGQLDRILRRDRNHPCVIAWSLGNEEPQQGTDKGARVTAAMQAHVRKLDPTRPTTFAFDNSWDRGAAKVVDVVGFNYRTDKIEGFHQSFPTVPTYGSETGSTVATRGAYANDAAAHVVRAYDTEHPWWASTAEAWWTIAATRPYISGGFVWTGFDYRGEPTPYAQFPSISSYFGILDTCGFPKDNFYYYRAWWRPDEPLVHLLPHWTWPGREGQPIEVWAHGNCKEVELLLNGRSLGRKAMPRNGHLAWSVPYAPGRIEARGYNKGRRVARSVRETAGPAAAVRLTADRRMTRAGGDDVAMLRAEVVDAKGRPVPDADQMLRFSVQGDGAIIGVGNGNPTSLEADVASERRAFHGLAQAILRVGKTPGPILATVSAGGLKGDAVRIVALRGVS
ncbi:beta-galactosidase GalA [Sphingomonas sp. Leaf343]|uniref:beta-galactosidase GalA n=1 Tax=Sphingomonas sp. Leaf343 TaxID=1736345 RepID=UPI0006F39CF7|nr:beta-galactosidase GalA [Sphingomonas sp. Leaf343]KQR87635.1 beta-galactosidase [Sphingomonas sp. Leaf343]